jgi:hypothetical protein
MKRIDITEVAKMVRTILKEAFPTHKFSVTSDRYAGGSSIDIRWTDGPTQKQVDKLTCLLEGKRFNGMDDSSHFVHHLIDGEEVTLGVDFIMSHRGISDGLRKRICAENPTFDSHAVWMEAQETSMLEERGSPTATTIVLTNPFLTEEKISA